VVARARSVRRTLEFARQHPQAILGLAPEGGDNPPAGALARPASGAGRFLLLLAGLGFEIVPVGAYEETGEFRLHFGPAYRLSVPDGLSTHEKDLAASETVIRAIATQLPERLRGSYA
jgi:hypothetical protein